MNVECIIQSSLFAGLFQIIGFWRSSVYRSPPKLAAINTCFMRDVKILVQDNQKSFVLSNCAEIRTNTARKREAEKLRKGLN